MHEGDMDDGMYVLTQDEGELAIGAWCMLLAAAAAIMSAVVKWAAVAAPG
jgi:hypothetical protein